MGAGDGRPNRRVVCWKSAADPAVDPVGPTRQWRQIGYPEQELLGAMYVSTVKGTHPLVVKSAGHWLWAGTGVRDGDQVPGLVSIEADWYNPAVPRPNGSGHTLLAESPYVGNDGKNRIQHSAIHQAPSGAWVFDSGTFGWAGGLRPSGGDPRIQRATTNLLARLRGS